MNVCGAKTRSGTPCKRQALPNGRCKLHGGKTPTGMALPQFRTGRYSKALPARLLAKYEAAQTDPDLLALREEVSLLDARLSDVLSRVDTGESGALWKQARQAMQDFRKARASGDACNHLLGNADDDIDRLMAAIRYLEEHV